MILGSDIAGPAAAPAARVLVLTGGSGRSALAQGGFAGAMGEGAEEARSLRLARSAARRAVEGTLDREESRGAHHRGDFPMSIDRWRVPRAARPQRGAHRDRDPATRH